jgi:hypothetical protein
VRRTTVVVLLTFVVLCLVFTYPLVLHMPNAVEDRQDALLNVWISAWDGHQLLADPVHLFDANIFHPYPRTLAYSELLLGNALLALPVTAATGNPVLGYNVALLLSFILSGLGTYFLVLRLTRSPGAGVVAGALFAFCTYRMTNLAQAQLLTTQWMPFSLLALYELLRRPRLQRVVTFVLFFCLQALSSFYYGILLALAVVVLGIGFWIPDRSTSRHLLLAVCCLTLIILPFALPYFQVQRELGFERSLADSEPFSASLRQYLMVPPGSVLHGRWLPSDGAPVAGGYPVDALFPGIITLALALWGLIRGRSALRWFFLFLLLASFLLSLGPRLYLAPGQPAGLDFELPYAWLYAAVPGFKALRAPVRFDALVMLSLAALSGYGVASLGSKEFVVSSTKGRQASLLVVPSILLLAVLELLVWPAARADPVPVGSQVPPVYGWLAQQPPAPVLELPMAFAPGGPQLEYQYLSTYHWHPTPDGYSGFIPPKHGQIVYEIERFPSERSVSLLQALGVRHVVVHAGRYPADRWPPMEAALAQMEELVLVETLGSDRVYRLQRRAFDSENLQVYAYLPPHARAGQPYTAYVVVINQGAHSYAALPTDRIHPAVLWEGMEGSTTVEILADVPLVTSPRGGAAVIPLPLSAPVMPGAYHVSVAEQDGSLGAWSSVGVVGVGDQGDEAFPVPARLEGWDVSPSTHPGDALPVRLTWRALGKIDAYYSIYVKLFDAQSNAVASWDGQPQDGQAPTLLWVPGETVEDVVTLEVPAGVPPGDYSVEVGMYRAQDLVSCLTLNQDGIPIDRVVLGTVRIEP